MRVVQLLNPKVAVLFLAFFPRPRTERRRAGARLGAVFIAVAVTIDLAYVSPSAH